jgi:hypothetical protein
MGLVRHGILLASLLVIIYQDMAPRASCGVNACLESFVLTVHQLLLCHVRTSGSQLGPSQHRLEEGRVPLGIHPAILQQWKCHPRD